MICCVCLLETINAIGISEEDKKDLKISEIISKHFWFKQEDILRAHICTICWCKIDDFHKFYTNIEKAHEEFHNAQQYLVEIKEEKNSIAIKQEEIDEDNYNVGVMDREQRCNTDLKSDNSSSSSKDYVTVNREQQFVIDFDNDDSNSTKNPLDDNDHNVNSEKESSDDEGDRSFILYESKTSRKRVKKNVFGKSRNAKSRGISKRCKKERLIAKSENNVEPKRKKAIFNRLDPLHTEEMIQKHIPMGCNLCVFVGKTFADIVAHFKADHPNTRAYITCCDKTFTKRFYVAQHAMTHENPDCFSCLLCNKSFTTTGGLQKHNLKYHAPDEELVFACDLCPQRFARQHLLQLHKPSHIPRHEWNFFCTKCPTSKAFASAYLLNIHDNKLHKREKNICNVCAKEIKDKKSFEKHVKEHYEGSGPRLKCPFPNCDSWLKDEDNLKLHLRRHNTDGETYKCPLCDKVCPNRRALSSHKVYVHSKEVFKCEYCDKSFKRAITLREHMTQHTGEVLYNCPFCTRTFNSNANMHSHKKKQHPVEWEALRRQKMGNNATETIIDISRMF